LLYHINKIYFKKAFHVMVLDETMQTVKFFKYLGGFSVKRESRQVIESLSYAASLLSDAQNMVVIFPQGKLYSNFIDEVIFEKGLFKITALATADFQYVFSAMFTENFDRKKPSVNVSFKVAPKVDISGASELQSAYQQHYTQAKQRQTQNIV
jgi:1-acyl-sn-glycerol-3-phosphate acyltransferase